MKICIYGAGAIGGWMGARLAQTGHDISVIARGATLSALRANGLQLVEDGKTTTASVEAAENGAELGPQDIVIVCRHRAAAEHEHRRYHGNERRSMVVLRWPR
jgi:2-dehydropantoate 2-reductase